MLQHRKRGLLTELGRIWDDDLMIEVADVVCRVRPGWTVGCPMVRRLSGRSVTALDQGEES